MEAHMYFTERLLLSALLRAPIEKINPQTNPETQRDRFTSSTEHVHHCACAAAIQDVNK